jgi:hypothetical protein
VNRPNGVQAESERSPSGPGTGRDGTFITPTSRFTPSMQTSFESSARAGADPAEIRAMIERELPENWRVQVAENASAHELADAWATNIGILHRAWWRAKDRREAIRFHERRLRELAG